MASKYAHLKGQVPTEEPSERDEVMTVLLAERESKTLGELTAEHNTLSDEFDEKKRVLDAVGLKIDACDILIRKNLAALDADSVSVNGRTWSTKFEPYPVAEDPSAIIKYFEEHHMTDQLVLKSSELASRLKAFVKEEAVNNELVITTKDVNGVQTTEVRSNIPGVKVFLKATLSRPKSAKPRS